MRFKSLSIFLLLFIVGSAVCSEPVIIETGVCRFSLYNYKLGKGTEDAIVFGVSRILDTYKDTFGFPYPDDFKVTVTILNDHSEFMAYQRKQIGKIISETGYFSFRYVGSVQRAEAVVWGNESVDEMLSVLFHETSHLILSNQVPWVPSWLNEGLAEYFEGLKVLGKNRRVFLNKNRSKWCVYWLRNGFPITLEKYVSQSEEQWWALRSSNINAAYTLGYSLVYFLMSRSNTEVVLKELLWDFKIHGKEADTLQVIKNNYNGGVERLERNWRRWIPRAKSYRPLRSLRKQVKLNKPKHRSLLDKETLMAVRKIDSEFSSWFGAENRYEAASPDKKKKIIEQWMADAQDGDLTKKTKAIAALGNVKAKEAVRVLVDVTAEPMSNNLPKWMAVRSLGRIGNKAAVPALIELVSHDDRNIRVYAKASLAEITGVYFGEDKEKWRKWQN